jgi:hypothetical protein
MQCHNHKSEHNMDTSAEGHPFVDAQRDNIARDMEGKDEEELSGAGSDETPQSANLGGEESLPVCGGEESWVEAQKDGQSEESTNNDDSGKSEWTTAKDDVDEAMANEEDERLPPPPAAGINRESESDLELEDNLDLLKQFFSAQEFDEIKAAASLEIEPEVKELQEAVEKADTVASKAERNAAKMRNSMKWWLQQGRGGGADVGDTAVDMRPIEALNFDDSDSYQTMSTRFTRYSDEDRSLDGRSQGVRSIGGRSVIMEDIREEGDGWETMSLPAYYDIAEHRGPMLQPISLPLDVKVARREGYGDADEYESSVEDEGSFEDAEEGKEDEAPEDLWEDPKNSWAVEVLDRDSVGYGFSGAKNNTALGSSWATGILEVAETGFVAPKEGAVARTSHMTDRMAWKAGLDSTPNTVQRRGSSKGTRDDLSNDMNRSIDEIFNSVREASRLQTTAIPNAMTTIKEATPEEEESKQVTSSFPFPWMQNVPLPRHFALFALVYAAILGTILAISLVGGSSSGGGGNEPAGGAGKNSAGAKKRSSLRAGYHILATSSPTQSPTQYPTPYSSAETYRQLTAMLDLIIEE